MSGHPENVTSVFFSPDGQSILTRSLTEARLWEANSGVEIKRFTGPSYITDIALSSESSMALVVCKDGSFKLWGADWKTEQKQLEGWKFPTSGISLSPHGNLALNQQRTSLYLWNLNSKSIVKEIEMPYNNQVISFLPNWGQVIGKGDDAFKIWDISNGMELKRFEGHDGLVWDAAFTNDGKHIVTGSGYIVRLWNIETGREIRQFRQLGKITSLALSRNNPFMLTGGQDGKARLWDFEKGTEIRQYQGHLAGIFDVAFSKSENFILTTSDDKTARLWGYTSPKVKYCLKPANLSVYGIC